MFNLINTFVKLRNTKSRVDLPPDQSSFTVSVGNQDLILRNNLISVH